LALQGPGAVVLNLIPHSFIVASRYLLPR
jgi:hypothetical protein